jgi:ABC-type sugar transport system ATPase subunit
MRTTQHERFAPHTPSGNFAPGAAMNVVMEARGLVKRYGQVTALDGADFDLRAGEILAVIGDNGAGKSSLIKALSGAVMPDAGEIRLDGRCTFAARSTHARPASKPSTRTSRSRRR